MSAWAGLPSRPAGRGRAHWPRGGVRARRAHAHPYPGPGAVLGAWGAGSGLAPPGPRRLPRARAGVVRSASARRPSPLVSARKAGPLLLPPPPSPSAPPPSLPATRAPRCPPAPPRPECPRRPPGPSLCLTTCASGRCPLPGDDGRGRGSLEARKPLGVGGGGGGAGGLSRGRWWPRLTAAGACAGRLARAGRHFRSRALAPRLAPKRASGPWRFPSD